MSALSAYASFVSAAASSSIPPPPTQATTDASELNWRLQLPWFAPTASQQPQLWRPLWLVRREVNYQGFALGASEMLTVRHEVMGALE